MWRENESAVAAWLQIADQWRIAPTGGPAGLDWPAVKVIVDALKIELNSDMLERLRIMEAAALGVFTMMSKANA